jgi:hypothetical protein
MITLAIALIAAATPVEPKAAPSPASAPVETITLQARPAAKSGAQRLCASMAPITGSLLNRRVCLTRDQWAARGMELPN